MPCYRMEAAAPPPQRSGRPSLRLDSGAVDGPSATSAIGVDRTQPGAGGRRPRFNFFSGTASAALFASLALCLVLVCAYSYVARRRTISDTRRRFLARMGDLDLVPGRLSSRVATARPAPAVAKTLSSPAVRGADTSSSGPAGDCPVCLEPLRGDVTAAYACGHVFHAPCIEPWLDRRGSCPVCRCTVSCGRDPANEAGTAAAGGGARRLRETVLVVITEETAAWAAGSDDDDRVC
jgi:cbb3-type cytochrome oxidase subunit 3